MTFRVRINPAMAPDPIAFLNGRTRRHAIVRRLRQKRRAIVALALAAVDWRKGLQRDLARQLSVTEPTIHYDIRALRAAGLIPPKDMTVEQWRLSQAMQAISDSMDHRDAEMDALRAEIAELKAAAAKEKQATE